jgi:hypothetical protein
LSREQFFLDRRRQKTANNYEPFEGPQLKTTSLFGLNKRSGFNSHAPAAGWNWPGRFATKLQATRQLVVKWARKGILHRARS